MSYVSSLIEKATMMLLGVLRFCLIDDLLVGVSHAHRRSATYTPDQTSRFNPCRSLAVGVNSTH